MYPIVEGYKRPPRRAISSISKIRFSSGRSTPASAFRRSTNLRPGNGFTRPFNTRRSTGTSSTGTTAPTFTTCSARSSGAARATISVVRYDKIEIYDPPRQLDCVRIGGGLFRPRTAAQRAEHRQPVEHRLARGRRQIYQHAARRWAESIMRRASHGARSPTSIMRRASARFPEDSTAGSIMACRCRCRTARSGSTRMRRHRRGQALQPARGLSISARSATTMSITGRRSGTARWKASRVSRSTRSPRAASPS